MLIRFWFRFRSPKPAASNRRRLRIEACECRMAPATFTAHNESQLIAHINTANLTPEADTINLPPRKTFSLTAVDNNTDGPNGLPVITDSHGLTIVGNGDVIERSSKAAPAFRLFRVAAGASLTLINV